MIESNSASPATDPASSPALEDLPKGSTRPASARFEVSQEPLLPANGGDEPPMGTYTPAPAYEHLGDLPPTYGSQSVYVVAYDPRQLFAYWDIDPGSASHTSYALRVCRGDGEVESEVSINPREAGRYLVIGVPGGTYYVELGTIGRAGRWRPVGFSGRVAMPAAGLAGEVEPKFATLPFHLSFQRLLELIHDAMGQGENLAAALARLQAGDRQGLDTLMGSLATLSQEQVQALERLLGRQANPRSDAGGSYGGGSESSAWAVHAGRNEKLSSAAYGGAGMSSEAFGSESLASAGGASEVIGAAAFGSETVSSQAFGSSERWTSISSASETLSSGAAGFGSETLASGALGFGSEFGSETMAAGALASGSETLASGALGFGSEILASGGLGLGSETFSSFRSGESSLEILQQLGIHSEAWSLASGTIGLGSETLASERTAHFFHSLEGNLASLSSMFSSVAEGLSSDSASSESVSSFGSGSF